MRVYWCFILFSIFTSSVYAYNDQITQGNCSPAVKDVHGNVTFNQYLPAEKQSLSTSNVEMIAPSLDPRDSPYTQSQKEGEVKKITPKSKALQIEQACTKGREKGYNYDFPTIDFKFQNTGNATAFLWQFAVHVLEAEIDATPVLKFEANAVEGALRIMVSNYGWGNSTCQFQLEEPTLNRLFTPVVRQKQITLGNVDGLEIFREVFRLTSEQANTAELAKVSEELRELANTRKEKTRTKIRGLPLGPFKVHWNCKGEKNVEYQGRQEFGKSEHDINVLTFFNGFEFVQKSVRSRGTKPRRRLSDTTYVAIIADPQQKIPQKLTYPLSREIPPGDLERFHIMIGSPMSAKLRLQFEFFIDKDKTVRSEIFEIHTWNPRNSRLKYVDGDELRRDLQDTEQRLAEERKENRQCQQAKPQLGSEDCDNWQLDKLEKKVARLKRQVDNYPFLASNPKNSDEK